MSNKYNQISNVSQGVHFSSALMGEVESSRMTASPVHLTTFNAGDIVPIYCREILPDETISMDMDFVIRQTTLLTPTMGNMHVDIYAFFVPNRIVNQSWKAVQGENLSGSWTANSVSLAPLVFDSSGFTSVPVGSVADYYGFPTQQALPNSVLSLCHDLKFRGYLMIYNEHFRDQNYQPPIPFSTLNVYNGFFTNVGSTVYLNGDGSSIGAGPHPSDGSFSTGSVFNSLFGDGSNPVSSSSGATVLGQLSRTTNWSALDKPLKANKLHDYFTSVLPSPQKSNTSVFAPASGTISSVPVVTSSESVSSANPPLQWRTSTGALPVNNGTFGLFMLNNTSSGSNATGYSGSSTGSITTTLFPSNLVTQDGASVTGLGISVDDLRMASAIQQVYEILARGGSRYREFVSSFFGIEVDDPYSDIPKCIGHISRDLDLYQTAQTSASESGSTPQGNLSAFGYTSSGGHLFSNRFIEHGYLHIFAIVRHKNLYSSFMARDNFRLNMLDFYIPPLANISEQPVYTREINPFAANPNDAFGYQEAWAEYRYEPDQVSGLMRSMPSGIDSLALWNYSDDFDSSLQISNPDWLKSNSEQVLNRTLAVTSSLAPQFKAQFKFIVDKTLPMPTYSVPGMDII